MEWTIEDLREEITDETAYYWRMAALGDSDGGNWAGIVEDVKNGYINRDDVFRVCSEVIHAVNAEWDAM